MCAGCGETGRPVAVQAGAVVVCDSCLARIAALVISGDAATVEALFGSRPVRTNGATSDGRAHYELAVAYQEKGLAGEALTELALAAAIDGGPESIAWPKLLEPLVARGTLAAAARAGHRRVAN